VKAAVAMDAWKLPIFKKHLDAAGYQYDEPVPLTLDNETLVLTVHCEWVHKLQPIVEAANRECAIQRRKET
jgi:hypothetical protein